MRLKNTLLAAAMLTPVTVNGQTGIPVAEMGHCDVLISQFIDNYQIPGASFAISKDGKLVYNRAFGMASVERNEPVQPTSIFRIASLSKPITAIAIMSMAESDLVELDSQVFGPNGILSGNTFLSTENGTDNRLNSITVQQLLEHSAGWDRDIDCLPSPAEPYNHGFSGCDPINFPLHVTSELSQSNPVTEEALVRFLMNIGLDFNPGMRYAYSNIGYLTLGLVIEELSGLSYEDYINSNILQPLGVEDMSIAKNLRSERIDREVEYYGNGGSTLSVYGDGTTVPWEYGGFSVEAMDAHGGWVATAGDLVRVINAVDGFDTKPDILTSESISSMTTPSTVSSFYAKGWSVNSAGNWWHTGSLDGTSSFMARTSGGFNWAMLLNKRNFGDYWTDLDELPWNCLRQTESFPTHDLSLNPNINASGLSASKVDADTLNVVWQNGDGDNRLLVVSENTKADRYPVDGSNYIADATFGQGDDIGEGSFAVYNGSGNSALLSGLTEGKSYDLRLFEYRNNSATGNNALYKISNAPRLSVEFTEGDIAVQSNTQTSQSGGGAMSIGAYFILLLFAFRTTPFRSPACRGG